MSCLNNHPYPVPRPAWPCDGSTPSAGTHNHNLSIFVLGWLAVREDSGSTTPTTARRGTRFELLDGRQYDV